MQGDKSLCLKSFPIKDEKGERSDLELERPPPRFCNPDIIDSQTLHSVGKFELPLGNKYLDFARCTMVHPGAAAAAAQRWLSWKMVADPAAAQQTPRSRLSCCVSYQLGLFLPKYVPIFFLRTLSLFLLPRNILWFLSDGRPSRKII